MIKDLKFQNAEDRALRTLLFRYDPAGAISDGDSLRLEIRIMSKMLRNPVQVQPINFARVLRYLLAQFERQSGFVSGAAVGASMVVLGIVIGVGIAVMTEAPHTSYAMASAMSQTWE